MRIPLVLGIICFVVSVLVDLYIYNDIKKSTKSKFCGHLYMIISVAFWLFLIVVVCLPRRAEERSILPIMWMLYSYLSVYFAKIVYALISLLGRMIKGVTRVRMIWHPMQWAGLVVSIAVFAIMWIGVIFTRHHIVVDDVVIESRKIPASFEGYKIVQLSDLHVGTWGNDTTFVSKLVDTVNDLHPDLIVFTGDIVNRKTDELLPFVNTLGRLKAKDGVVSVLGNHDYGDYVDWKSPEDRELNNNKLAQLEARMGWRLLKNERIYLHCGKDSIMMIGVENWGEPPFHTYGDLNRALSRDVRSKENQNDNHYKILLSHNPEHWNRVVSRNTNIDLTLSGHTHAMQAMTKIGKWHWSPAKYRYAQWDGIYKRANRNGYETMLYVNIGAGEVGLPARLLEAYPEITCITLRHIPAK